MGASHDDFVKYPRTPHLFGSRGTDDDKHLGEAESLDFIADASLIVEEKLDGTNVGIHFTTDGPHGAPVPGAPDHRGNAPAVRPVQAMGDGQAARAGRRCWRIGCILFGEWVYARHSVHYRRLPHYFFEFDIYDKQRRVFLIWTAAGTAGRDRHPHRARCSTRAGGPGSASRP